MARWASKFSTNYGNGKGAGKRARRLQRQGVRSITELQEKTHRRDAAYSRKGGIFEGLQLSESEAGFQLRILAAAADGCERAWREARENMATDDKVVNALYLRFCEARDTREAWAKHFNL